MRFDKMSTDENMEDVVDYDEDDDDEMHASAVDNRDRFRPLSWCPTFSDTDGYDSSVAQTGTIAYVDDVLTIAAPHAFRGEHPPMEMHFPMVYNEVERDEMIERMFPEMHESAVWDIQFDKDYVDHVSDYLKFMRIKLVTINIRTDDGVSLAVNVDWKSFGRSYRSFRDQEVETGVHRWLDHFVDGSIPKLSIIQLANIVRNMDVETTRYLPGTSTTKNV